MERDRRLSVVILTHNRVEEVTRTVERMRALPEWWPIVVVDNASTDGTPTVLKRRFPELEIIALSSNLGAAGRNAGVCAVATPYIAFCDDDTWWAPGSLARAAALLDAHPRAAVLSARVLVGPAEREDTVCAAMAASPLPSAGLPGRSVLGFLAGASVMRRSAFLSVVVTSHASSLEAKRRSWPWIWRHKAGRSFTPMSSLSITTLRRVAMLWCAGSFWLATRSGSPGYGDPSLARSGRRCTCCAPRARKE